MAGKKREGIDALKTTAGGKKREDRQVLGKSYFEPISIDARNVLTVIYLLRSPEDNVMLRAVASLEVFGSKDRENFNLLVSLGIFEYLYPLVYHEDNIVKRFTLKLIGMLSGFENFRRQMLEVEDVLPTFVGLLRKEADVVLQEFSALTLAELTKDPQAASDLLKVDQSIETLFTRIVSPDPDIEKNCLDIFKNLLNDINGIDAVVENPSFDINLILNLTSSTYPVIQALTIEVLKQLTSMCKNQTALLAFRDAKGIETTLTILGREDWLDLHQGALDLLLNLVECPELCDYLLKSGCLNQMMTLLEANSGLNFTRRVLGILARISQTQTGATALLDVGMFDRFTEYLSGLSEDDEIVETNACLGIANLAQFGQILKQDRNPVPRLSEIASNSERSLTLRNMAAYALNILSKVDKVYAEALLESERYKIFYPILLHESELLPELCQNLIQMFIGISQYDDFKVELINEPFFNALLSCLPTDSKTYKDPSLHVDALECLAEFLTEVEGQSLFHSLKGVDLVINCLRSRYASVRDWAGYFTVIASQSVDFVKDFIRKNGLEWMISEKKTLMSMPSWRSAIESIFTNYLPAKFAYTGRLDFQDITQDGFYVYSTPRSKFTVVEELLQMRVSPIVPVYLAYFGGSPSNLDSPHISETSSRFSVYNSEETRISEKVVEGPRRKTAEERNFIDEDWSRTEIPSVDYGRHGHIMNDQKIVSLEKFLPDPYLKAYLEHLRSKIEEEDYGLRGVPDWGYIHPDLIRRRVKLIANVVDREMSGPEPDLSCLSPYKDAHLKEMKFFLGTNVLPLGGIRMGGYLERAMLFKVLADRTGFPCALVRGSFGRAWVEVAVPVLNVESTEETNLNEKSDSAGICGDSKTSDEILGEDEETSLSGYSAHTLSLTTTEDCFWYPKINIQDFKCFPREYLKPNAVVDLITTPGKILWLDSFEADEYCGKNLHTCSKSVRSRPCSFPTSNLMN